MSLHVLSHYAGHVHSSEHKAAIWCLSIHRSVASFSYMLATFRATSLHFGLAALGLHILGFLSNGQYIFSLSATS